MPNFKISLEIELDANSPLEAAKLFESWVQERGTNWQYYVQNDETNEIFSVDLQEEDEDAVLPVLPENYTPIIQ
jgi:hypothetical protein